MQEQPEPPLVTGGTGSPGFPRGLQGAASTSPSQRMLEDTRGESVNHSTHNTRGQRRKPRGCGGPKTQGKSPAGAVPMRGREQLGSCDPLHSGPWDAATACPHEEQNPWDAVPVSQRCCWRPQEQGRNPEDTNGTAGSQAAEPRNGIPSNQGKGWAQSWGQPRQKTAAWRYRKAKPWGLGVPKPKAKEQAEPGGCPQPKDAQDTSLRD